MKSCVADIIIEFLGNIGVEHIYGVPGDSINDIIEAIRKQDKIKFIHVRHEESGAFAAACHAKLTGKLGVCVGTSGGGAIHLLNGLYDAKLDHAPVLAITGQIDRSELGNTSHQEIDSNQLFEGVTVFNQTLVKESQTEHVLAQAIQHAYTRNGVAHISLPADVAKKSVEQPSHFSTSHYHKGSLQAAPEYIENAVDLINACAKPVLLVGNGAAGAMANVIALAEKIKAPIIRTLKAKHLISDDHPLSMGGLGLLGTEASVHAIDNCDLLILAGTDFPYSDFLPTHGNIIQIDNKMVHIGRRAEIKVGLHADCLSALATLHRAVQDKFDQSYLHACQTQKEKYLNKIKDEIFQDRNDTDTLIKPQRLAYMVGQLAAENTIFICDTGAVTGWVARYLPMKTEQQFTLSGNLGTMGFAVGGAIGAKLGQPDKPVVALIGDGGFGMMMQDFLTAVRYGLDITFVVFNNGKLGLIQLEQETAGMPEYQTELHNPDYAKYAQLCGGSGFTAETVSDLSGQLAAALEGKGASIIDVKIDPEEILMPPKVHLKQAMQFGIAKVKESLGA